MRRPTTTLQHRNYIKDGGEVIKHKRSEQVRDVRGVIHLRVKQSVCHSTIYRDRVKERSSSRDGSVELAKDLLGHGEHVVGHDLNAIIVDFLSAIHEVIGLDVGELLGKTLAVLVFLLITRGMKVEAVGNDSVLEAIVLADRDT